MTTTKKKDRVIVVDALRGFAVMAIALLHNCERFNFYIFPKTEDQPMWLNTLDKNIWDSLFFIFAGKAYAIFALLFGFTFFIQSNNQLKKGKDFGNRYLWRLLLLVGFAFLNAIFFPGDVLLLFSATGLVLFLVRNWSNKAAFILALFFLIQPIEWFHYIQSLVIQNYQLPTKISSELFKEVANYVKTESFLTLIKNNFVTGQAFSFMWAVEGGRFLQTAGLFIIGMLLGRTNFYSNNSKNRERWVKTLVVAALLFFPLYFTKNVLSTTSTPIEKGTIWVVFDMWSKLAFTFILVPSFLILSTTKIFSRITRGLRTYGRMSLTNYISQSVIGSILYFYAGFALAPKVPISLSFLIGIVMIIVQVQFCKWWFKKYNQGPLEKLWHNLTWIKS